jgi:flavorubredoxin
MTIDQASGTAIDEIADGIYRINTPVTQVPGGFSFNRYLVVDEQPLLFQTGPRGMFPLTRAAIESVMPVERLRWIGFSHHEDDEDGALNLLLSAAPDATPLCGRVNAMINASAFDRAPRALAHEETLVLGKREVRWLDAPHLPHAWECGYLFESQTRTLFCGDLFTQGGANTPALTEGEILGPSDAFRKAMDYFSYTPGTSALLEQLAATQPATLACMHGSAWRGDGAKLLRALGDSLEIARQR